LKNRPIPRDIGTIFLNPNMICRINATKSSSIAAVKSNKGGEKSEKTATRAWMR
jgi:hypothetical protein